MSSEAARKMSQNSKKLRVNAERFAYDMFSYILPICGFPETAIPRTDLEENEYEDKDFVRKSSLLVLPLSMYVRDTWKKIFELRHSLTPLNSLEFIKKYLETTLTNNPDFNETNEATRIRISLSFFTEIMLFFNYKGLETHVGKLSEFWSHFYSKHVTENHDIEGLFASSFFKFPEATGSSEWIISFVEEFAIPYGCSNLVSEHFSIYSVENNDCGSGPLSKTSMNNSTDNSSNIPGASNLKVKKSATRFAESIDPPSTLPSCHEVSDPSQSSAFLGTDSSLKAKPCIQRQTDVSAQRPKEHQELSSELEIDETFGQMSLKCDYAFKERQGTKPE